MDKEYYAKLKIDGKSWKKIAAIYNKNESTFYSWQKIRESIRNTYERMIKVEDNTRVGVFSDLHAPFNHVNYLQFVKDTFDKWEINKVICVGDLVDHHAISRFISEPDADGAKEEFKKAKLEVEKVKELFPKLTLTLGNHDLIPIRQAKTLGLGDIFIKNFEEIYNLPDTWNICEEIIYNDVLYKHGLNAGGRDGALNSAIKEQMSVVIGHYHAFGGCKYAANKRNLIFGMNTGCGIDVRSYAAAYGKYSPNRPTLGCGIVVSSTEAYFVPMGEEYFIN